METRKGDSLLFFIKEKNGLCGWEGLYIDDLLLVGDEGFQRRSKTSLEKCKSKPLVWDEVEFLLTNIRTIGTVFDRCFTTFQPEYSCTFLN